MLTTVLILIAALIVLIFGAHYLVNSSIHIAKLLRIPEALIGLTIVAAGTSAPEIAVSVTAALHGEGALSVGNVIGSNIFNLGFILGIIAVIRPQKISKKMVYRDGSILLLSTILVLFFLWNQYVSFFEGACLLTLLFAYNTYLFIKKDVPMDGDTMEELQEETHRPARWHDFITFIASLIVIITAADYVVASAVDIATSLGMSQWAIGATIVAAGTSLPEVATSVMATFKKKFDLAIGNVVGSDIFNALGIIGVSSVISPMQLDSNTIWGLPDNIVSLILLVGTIFIVMIFMRTGWTLSRREGALLLLISVARMGFELMMGS